MTRRSPDTSDLTNKKFGNWIVLGHSGGSNWLVRCDCGTERKIRRATLTNGSSRSCGCIRSLQKSTVLIPGDQYNWWTVIKYAGDDKWLACCKCGTERAVHRQSLVTKSTQSCGCYRESNLPNLIGQKFTKLTVLELTNRTDNNYQRYWKCECDCGAFTEVPTSSLRNGGIRSCGCLLKESMAVLIKHKMGDISVADFCKKKNIPYSSGLKIFKTVSDEDFAQYANNYENSITRPEFIVENEMGIKRFNLEILENAKYRPDFKLNDNLFLNVDGLYWHNLEHKGDKYHLELRVAFEKENKRILQFYEDEIYHSWPIVQSIINNAYCEGQAKIFARKCTIRSVSGKEAAEFFSKNHLMGHNKSSRTLGLYYNGVLVSCMSYRRYIKEQSAEISRSCSILNTIVVGGFQKLLAAIEAECRHFGINNITSFCDLRYATGSSYRMAGFIPLGITQGWCWSDNKNRFNRLKCRAGRGHTEKENAAILKWFKIYDAGQAKYKKILL